MAWLCLGTTAAYDNFHDYQSYTSVQASHWLEMLGWTCSPYCMPGATGSSRYRERQHKQRLSRERKEERFMNLHVILPPRAMLIFSVSLQFSMSATEVSTKNCIHTCFLVQRARYISFWYTLQKLCQEVIACPACSTVTHPDWNVWKMTLSYSASSYLFKLLCMPRPSLPTTCCRLPWLRVWEWSKYLLTLWAACVI